jgi:hypothetical protein
MYSILEYDSAKLFVPNLEGTPFCLITYLGNSNDKYLAVCIKLDDSIRDEFVIPEMITKEPIEINYFDEANIYCSFELYIPRDFGWRLHKNSWGLLGSKYTCWVFSRPPEHVIIKLMSCLENLYKNNIWSR